MTTTLNSKKAESLLNKVTDKTEAENSGQKETHRTGPGPGPAKEGRKPSLETLFLGANSDLLSANYYVIETNNERKKQYLLGIADVLVFLES